MNNYNGNSMDTLEGLDVVRKRPGMYIGGTDGDGIKHCFIEVTDNAIDEVLAGFCDLIEITFSEDGYITISDNGRGIPIDINDKSGICAAILVYTNLHSGGKFENKNYKFSGGLHGVGASVVNALSSRLTLEIKRDGKLHFIEFIDGGTLSREGFPEVTGDCPVSETGTAVRYKLDPSHFESAIAANDWEIKLSWLSAYLKERVSITDNLTIKLDYKGDIHKFKSVNGLADLIKIPEYSESATPIMKDPIIFHEEVIYKGTRQKIDPDSSRSMVDEKGNPIRESYKENIELKFAFLAQDKLSPIIPTTFVNNIKTKNHGKHLDGFIAGYTLAVRKYATERLKIPANFISEDITTGSQIVILAYAQDIEFKGQTKDQVMSHKLSTVISRTTEEFFSRWLDTNPIAAKQIIEKSIRANKQRIKNAEAKEIEDQLEQGSSTENLTGILTTCSSKNIAENELFVVEGASAGGTARNARCRKTQAILPLRGKILNTYKGDIEKAMKNKQIRIIASAIGTGVGKEYDYSKLKYGKIIPLTDADVDGAHIQLLFISFMFKFLPELIKKGHLFIAKTPLYKLEKKGSIKKTVKYVLNDKEFNELYPDGVPSGWDKSRFKGLGEMNPEQLRATAMNGDSRKLEQVIFTESKEKEYTNIFDVLMGDDPSKRYEFITKHIDFQE